MGNLNGTAYTDLPDFGEDPHMGVINKCPYAFAIKCSICHIMNITTHKNIAGEKNRRPAYLERIQF